MQLWQLRVDGLFAFKTHSLYKGTKSTQLLASVVFNDWKLVVKKGVEQGCRIKVICENWLPICDAGFRLLFEAFPVIFWTRLQWRLRRGVRIPWGRLWRVDLQCLCVDDGFRLNCLVPNVAFEIDSPLRRRWVWRQVLGLDS